MTFRELELHEKILSAIEAELGDKTPTPIQLKAIPKILGGFDIRASAQTGTGKTLAFIAPALNKLTAPATKRSDGPRILILVPTRELAMQVAGEAVKFSKHLPHIKTVCIFGGAPYPPQNRQLSRPYDILVATPGRLIDHVSRGRINLAKVEMFILDEADRMLDMGFIQPVEQIASSIPDTRQTLLFSATLKGSVMKLSERLLNKPIEISIAPTQTSQENIEQRLYFVNNIGDKYSLLDHFLGDISGQAIIFTSTKQHAGLLLNRLLDLGHHAAALHGDMNQHQRTRTIARLRQGEIKILVATDVAARGIDVLTISHVINFDLPGSAEDYVHRIGRTGRAGGKGIALSFSAGRDLHLVKKIELFTGQKIPPHSVPGLEFTFNKNPKPAPSRNRPPQRRSGPPGRGGPPNRGGSTGRSGGAPSARSGAPKRNFSNSQMSSN